MNRLLSTSFLLQYGRRIPILGLSSNQWTVIIVSSPLGFSKSLVTSFLSLLFSPWEPVLRKTTRRRGGFYSEDDQIDRKRLILF